MSPENRRYEVILPPTFPEELFLAAQGIIKHGGGKIYEIPPAEAATIEADIQGVSESLTIIPVPEDPAVRIRRSTEIIIPEEPVPPSTNLARLEAESAVAESCHEIAVKYENSFDVDMPEYRGFFSAIRHLGLDERRSERHRSNYSEQVLNGVTVGYSFHINTARPYNYKKGGREKRFELSEVAMFIRDASKGHRGYTPHYEPNLYIKFDKGTITGIGLRWDQRCDLTGLEAVLDGTLLGDYLEKLSPSIDHKQRAREKGLQVTENSHDIYFDFKHARTEVKRRFKVNSGGDMDSLRLTCKYEMNESGYVLQRDHTKYGSHTDADLQADFGIILPDSLPIKDYTKIVQSLFGLIPAH